MYLSAVCPSGRQQMAAYTVPLCVLLPVECSSAPFLFYPVAFLMHLFPLRELKFYFFWSLVIQREES